MARSPQSLDELKSSIEESMAEALQQNGPDEPEFVQTIPPAETTTQPEARSNADELVQVCNTTAAEIQATGELPALVVAHGGSIRVMLCLSDPRGLSAFHEFKVPNVTVVPF